MDYQVLARRGEGGYRQYRIPAMAVTTSGRIIAIYDARPDLDDLPSPVDLVIRMSDDNGDSWSAQKIFAESSGVHGFGDASIIIDPTVGKHGRILVFAQETERAGFFESDLGSDHDDPTIVQIALWISDDDGETWRKKLITNQLKDEKTYGIFASSGMGTRIASSGRLIHGFVLRREGALLGALAFSDDHGETWKLGAEIPEGNESTVAVLEDQSILIHSRATPFRIFARSMDGGVTLSSIGAEQSLPDPSDNGSLCSLTTGEIVCTNNHDRNLRRKTVAKISSDGGHTWPMAVMIEPDSSAYSTSCELSNGQIGVLFERNGYSEIVFCRIDKSDFVPIEEAIATDYDEDGIEFTITLRFVRPGRTGVIKKDVSELHYMPQVDMSQWKLTSRKEVGVAGGSTSGDPIYTREELNELLGPITPGLHVGDEMRFSGRFSYAGNNTIRNISIRNSSDSTVINRDYVRKEEEIVFLDIRHVVSVEEVAKGFVELQFFWNGDLESSEGVKMKVMGGHVTKRYLVSDGIMLQ